MIFLLLWSAHFNKPPPQSWDEIKFINNLQAVLVAWATLDHLGSKSHLGLLSAFCQTQLCVTISKVKILVALDYSEMSETKETLRAVWISKTPSERFRTIYRAIHHAASRMTANFLCGLEREIHGSGAIHNHNTPPFRYNVCQEGRVSQSISSGTQRFLNCGYENQYYYYYFFSYLKKITSLRHLKYLKFWIYKPLFLTHTHTHTHTQDYKIYLINIKKWLINCRIQL